MPIESDFDDFLKEQGMFELCTAAAKKSTLETAPFDAADYLDDDATMAAYLAAAKAERNPAINSQALVDLARARKAINLAKTTVN
jgi:DNA-binding phage protein